MKKVRSKRSPSFWRNIKSVPRRNGKTAKWNAFTDCPEPEAGDCEAYAFRQNKQQSRSIWNESRRLFAMKHQKITTGTEKAKGILAALFCFCLARQKRILWTILAKSHTDAARIRTVFHWFRTVPPPVLQCCGFPFLSRYEKSSEWIFCIRRKQHRDRRCI